MKNAHWALLLVVPLFALAPGTAHAAEPAPTAQPTPEKLYSVITTGGFRVNPKTGKMVPGTSWTSSPYARQGSGGSTSASGCRKAWVQNVERNLLGSIAFRYRLYINWCWNRAKKRITSAVRSQAILDLSSQWRYRGIISKAVGYYAWGSGYPYSGHRHYKMLAFENCVLKYGCIQEQHPKAVIRAHSNGTWTWGTDGDGKP